MRGVLSIFISSLFIASQMVWPEPALAQGGEPVTPIRHIVVIFDENISFDHYFGTYPHALNPSGEPQFHARRGTPTVNGLDRALLEKNPNLNPANGAGASNPFRLDRWQALTADQNHDYGPEQASFDSGLMDLFPVKTGAAGPPPAGSPPVIATPGLVMGYYDGNTVTAMWNYAQYFAMVCGRIQSKSHECERDNRMQSKFIIGNHIGGERLRSASRAVPVLCIDA